MRCGDLSHLWGLLMAILGVGVDVVEVERVRRVISRGTVGRRFKRRVFTAAERDYCEARSRSWQSYAARFAAKEAVMKALGLEGRWGFPWPEIEIVSTASGSPRVVLHGRVAARARRLHAGRVHVSLSHAHEVAVANAVVEASE